MSFNCYLRSMKKVVIATLAMTALLTSGVATADTSQSPEPWRCAPDETYYMNVMVSGVEYWFPVYEMFKAAAQSMGCKTVYTGTPVYEVDKQLASFEQVLARKPAGILLHPMQADPFIEPINRAVASGVPVVTFAADSPNSDRISYITTDDQAAAEYAAKVVAEDMGGSGEYAVLENPGQSNHDIRVKAFINYMEENYPDMTLVSRAQTNQDSTKAYNSVLSMAQGNPNLGAVFMPEAVSALGAAQAAKELGGNIRIFNGDVNAKILDLIKTGEVMGAINPDQGMQGWMGFMSLYMAAHPELIDPMNDSKRSGWNPMRLPYVDNGFSVVTAENADDFYWDRYLEKRGTNGINE